MFYIIGTTPGSSVKLQYEDSIPHAVHSVSMATGNGATGSWEIIFNQDQTGKFIRQ